MGTRTDDGVAPEAVRIEYERTGDRRTAVVSRTAGTQRVEFSEADTARFWTPDGTVIITDAVLDVTPVGVARNE